MADVWRHWTKWPEVGDVSESGFCCVCRSHFCPHAYPALYAPERQQQIRDLQRYAYSRWR